MEIQTTLKLSTLQTINTLWPLLDFENTKRDKIDLSIVQYTAAKFMKKEASRIGKPKDKEFKMSLHYFELATIEDLLRTAAAKHLTEFIDYTRVTNYCNQINQKII
ncbi:hypothetical protein [Flavobacterium caeni]|uniref:Uncharacterized protein n=1 Tax=Flavobacterium caeni TaxID=490189 RepID=A0A1G5K308_9FLAO|nr:hypothetical protein [Flavobacterium caeni]SCY94408.1 hypothetical protein SAMN02927903_03025 [Flavobacterium caeni]